MKYVLIFIFTLSNLISKGQGFRYRHYVPGAADNVTRFIFETQPGSYIGGGLILDSLSGATLICINGFNEQGQFIWKKKYGNSKFQYVNNGFISRSFYKKGNNIYCATAALDSNNVWLGVLINFNLNGDTIWQKRFYDPSDYMYPQMVTGSVDGGFLITGFCDDLVNSASTALLIKTDAYGNELWRKKISKITPNGEDGKAIIQDTLSKKIVIAGYQYIGNSTSWTDYPNILILDSLGTKLNQLNYMPSPGGRLMDLIQTKDKKIVAVGAKKYWQSVGGTNLSQAFAVKFDLNAPAPFIWSLAYDQLQEVNQFSEIIELQNGEILLGGLIDTMQLHNMPTNGLIRLTKINQNGVVTWNRYYDYKTNSPIFDNYPSIMSLNTTKNGSWIGSIAVTNSPGPNPFFFVKWDATGCDSTLVYCQSLITNTNTAGINASSFTASDLIVFPNPANDVINISTIEQNGIRELGITFEDVTGSVIKQVKVQSTDDHFKVNVSDLNSGTYIIEIRNNKDLEYRGKFIKLN